MFWGGMFVVLIRQVTMIRMWGVKDFLLVMVSRENNRSSRHNCVNLVECRSKIRIYWNLIYLARRIYCMLICITYIHIYLFCFYYFRMPPAKRAVLYSVQDVMDDITNGHSNFEI